MCVEVVAVTDPEALDLPDEVRDPFRASPYAVPLSTLIGGAYVGVTDQVQLQPASPPHLDSGHVAPTVGGDDGD
jgi:hypothetical protein